jgi:hypothetical protein
MRGRAADVEGFTRSVSDEPVIAVGETEAETEQATKKAATKAAKKADLQRQRKAKMKSSRLTSVK